MHCVQAMRPKISENPHAMNAVNFAKNKSDRSNTACRVNSHSLRCRCRAVVDVRSSAVDVHRRRRRTTRTGRASPAGPALPARSASCLTRMSPLVRYSSPVGGGRVPESVETVEGRSGVWRWRRCLVPRSPALVVLSSHRQTDWVGVTDCLGCF